MIAANLKRATFSYRLWRAQGTNAVRAWWREIDHNHLHVLSRDPAIVYLWWGRDDSALHAELRGRPLTVLYMFPWCTTPEDIPGIAAQAAERKGQFPEHRIVFLCNEPDTVEPLRRAGAEAVFCNQNAFLNEDIFRPLNEIPKEYDAVYNASLAPYKRHHLAAKVSSLAILSYAYSGAYQDTYGAEVRGLLAHANWLKDSRQDSEKVSVEQMVGFYNRAHVGLILSAIEGSVFASMEYLLCGLPVVSTPSVGGRDVFWDDRFVIVCEPEAEAVAEAVQELKARKIDPQLVRSATLERVAKHRQVLSDLMAPDIESIQCPWPPGSHGPFTFFDEHKLGKALRLQTPIELP
jgi:glycosyltransferase involved in cell wall biosynthesis